MISPFLAASEDDNIYEYVLKSLARNAPTLTNLCPSVQACSMQIQWDTKLIMNPCSCVSINIGLLFIECALFFVLFHPYDL